MIVLSVGKARPEAAPVASRFDGAPRSKTDGIGLEAARIRNLRRSLLWCAICALLPGCGLVPAVVDSDGDGLNDRTELELGTDPAAADTDGDGLDDGTELTNGTSPLAPDSDHDGISDGTDPLIDEPSRARGSISSGNDVEPNDEFLQAVMLDNIGATRLVFEGKIDRADDVDVFELGPFQQGDRLTLDFEHRDNTLRPVIALFDADEFVFDRRVYPFTIGGLDVTGLIDQTVRRASVAYRLAIAGIDGDVTLGAYRLVVTIERSGTPPPPRGQAVLLGFDGGWLDPPILGVNEVSPFSAAAIDDVYAGQDETLKGAIVEAIRNDFAGLDVLIFTADEPIPVGVETYTTILLGSFNSAALGAAVGVDPFNQDPCDDGVVFTESFRPSTFGFAPEIEDLGLAIGQVTSHEIGHLLGLRHVVDASALMDEQSPAVALLIEQTFTQAALSQSVFPIGWQDASALLLDTIGSD